MAVTIYVLSVMCLAGIALASVSAPIDVDGFTRFLQNVGFPIAVAAYVLVRIEPAIRDLIGVVKEMRGFLEGLESREHERRRR